MLEVISSIILAFIFENFDKNFCKGDIDKNAICEKCKFKKNYKNRPWKTSNFQNYVADGKQCTTLNFYKITF